MEDIPVLPGEYEPKKDFFNYKGSSGVRKEAWPTGVP